MKEFTNELLLNILKDDKYSTRKKASLQFSKYIKGKISVSMQNRVDYCASFLSIIANETLEKRKLYKADFCNHYRFCPMCAWRKARKDALKVSIIMDYIRQELELDFIFVTLTAPTVYAHQLTDQIDKYNLAFKNLLKRKPFLGLKGYIRKLEVTYDRYPKITNELYKKKKRYYDIRRLKPGDTNPTYDKYHPHFHVIFCVSKEYKKNPVEHEIWLSEWQTVMKDKSITQVKIEKVRKNNGKEVLEISKYLGKDSDYLYSQEVFNAFYAVLKGRQVITYNGEFKTAVDKFKKGELDYLFEKDIVDYVYKLFYNYTDYGYYHVKTYELTEDEKKSLCGELIREVKNDND